MTKAIHLTLAQVKKAGLLAYHEKRLSAQGPTPSCMYRDASGRPCVIGAALTDEQAAGIPESPLVSLIFGGMIVTGAIRGLPRLQELHDRWATAVRDQKPHIADAEAKFLALLEGREP